MQKNRASCPVPLVVKAGLEPARRLKHKILNLACLPIPPLDQNDKRYQHLE